MHYLPLTPSFFSIFVGLLAVLIALLQIRALRFAYESLGISSGAAILLLVGSLIGSYFNIPIWSFPERQILSGQEISIFGAHYVVPFVRDWPGTVIAINVGGALIPTLTSLYLLVRHRLWIKGLAATFCVAALCYQIARPVPGLGIALPTLLPAGVTAIVALVLSREQAAPIAYIAGSLGTLIGADLLNLAKVQGIGAPVASIGGAGTFDGVFLIGVLAVLLASFPIFRRAGPSPRPQA